MGKNIKKVLFGGYDKKSTEEVLENLVEELAETKEELSKQQQQFEKEQSELKSRLAAAEAEASAQVKLSKEQSQKLNEKQLELTQLNALLEESLKTTAEYNNNLNRIGEVYALAYDSAYRMAQDAQSSAEQFVGVVCDNVVEAQNELSQLKFAAIEIKSTIAQRLEQLRRQFLSLQEHLLAIADEELLLSDTIKDLDQIKEKTIQRIGDELKQYSLKNKTFNSTLKFAPTPLENIINKLHVAPPLVKVAEISEIEPEVDLSDNPEKTTEEPVAETEAQESIKEEVKEEVKEIPPAEEKIEPAVTSAPFQEVPLSPAVPEPALPKEQNSEAVINKQKSVKDILKKYGNL